MAASKKIVNENYCVNEDLETVIFLAIKMITGMT